LAKPGAFRRVRVENFADLLRARKEFYANKASEYLPDPDRPGRGDMKLWKENRIKSDVYDEILAEIVREFDLEGVQTGHEGEEGEDA